MMFKNVWENLLQVTNRQMKRFLGVGFVRAGGEFDVARRSAITLGKCTVIVDGGANSGQWSKRARRDFSAIKIISFEPLSEAFRLLDLSSSDDKNWLVRKEGLGSVNGVRTMFVSSNEGMSSSYQKPTNHLMEFKTVTFVRQEAAEIRRLDTYEELYGQSIYLKLDIQGAEWDAIQGCTGLLEDISAIEVETSLESMYEGDQSHYELIPKIIALGYKPYAISPAHKHSDGRCTYMDVILLRESLLS
jgi:FkbM family methyltransferase